MKPLFELNTPLRQSLATVALCASTLLVGCGALNAQNPSGMLRPVNAVPEDGQTSLMLKGHDVVAYFTQGRHALGSPQHQSVYQDVTFRFASAEHKKLFDAAPERYMPQFNGYCANGIVYGIPWGGDADTWLMHEGKLYIFGGAGSKAGFEVNIPKHVELANRYWGEEVKGSNSFWQRSKRLVMRVPHYKSGSEIAAEVAAAKVR